MIQCPFCNTELPEGARFCGSCGRMMGERAQNGGPQPTQASNSGRSSSPTFYDTRESFDPGREFERTVGGLEAGVELPTTAGESFDPNLGSATLLGESIGLQHGNVPLVHGTPQAGGVPFVQGTPTVSDGSPSYQSPEHLHQIHHQQGFQPQQTQLPHLHQVHHQQGFQAQYHQQPLHLHSPVSHQQVASAHIHQSARASRIAQQGCRPSCLTTVITGAVLVTTIVTLAVFFFPGIRNTLLGHGQPPPALILNGRVVPGGLISIHGSNFSSGGTISITVDGHSATIVSGPAGNQVSSNTHGLETFALGAYQAANEPSSGSTVTVKSDGSFDVAIRLDASWPAGSSHEIVAMEQSSSQSAHLTIVVPQRTALTSCSRSTNTTTLTLGPVTEGQAQPVAAPFALCTTGSGTVNWTSSWNQQQATWLHLSSSGKIQAPLVQQVLVSASAAGLKAGTYQATVTFSSQGSSLKMVLNVTLIVRAPNTTACINTSTQALSFTATQGNGNPASQTVTLANCGDPNTWNATTNTDDGAKWLGIGSNGGTLQSKGTQNVSIKVTSTMLVAGTYSGRVTFKVGSSMAIVNIILTVQPPAQNTCIIANPNALGFTATQGQGNPGPQTLTIGNCGSSGAWSAFASTTDGADWLSINQAHGTLDANGTSNVSIKVTSAGLQLGTYTGQITFKMGSSTATVSVFFDIKQMQDNSCISTDTGSLVFTTTQGEGDPYPEGLTLLNCGTPGDWSVSAANNSNWLGVEATHGHLGAGGSRDILVAARTGQLGPGVYRDRLIFTLGSSLAVVNITLVVQPPSDCIQTGTQELNFIAIQGGDSPIPQKVTIGNCGGTAGDWSASSAHGSTWLGFHRTHDHLEVGATEDVKVGVLIVGLAQGDYHDRIAFRLGSSTAVVEVNLLVEPPVLKPCIQASTNSLVFTATQGQSDPEPQTVTLTNCGPAGDWSASSAHGSNWLNANNVNGHLDARGTPGASQDVLVMVSIAKLTTGKYYDRIAFKLGTSTASVDIELIVLPPTTPPCIKASTTSLTFTETQGQGDPAPKTVTITNCGPAGDWSATSANNSPWLGANLVKGHLEGNASQDVSVSVAGANLKTGQYRDQIIFTLGSATVKVNVIFTIALPEVPPTLIVSPSLLDSSDAKTCSLNSDSSGWTCNVTVTEDASSSGSLNWTVSTDLAGVNFNPTGGTLTPGGSTQVGITIPVSSCTRGTFNFAVQGGKTVAVPWKCTQPGGPPPPPPPSVCIKADAEVLNFSATQGQGNPASQTVTITNCGTAGDWSEASANNSAWLGASPANGHLEGNATQGVSVSVASGNLNPGTYRDVLIFSLGGSTAKVAVIFTIAPAAPPPPPPSACIKASTEFLSFSATDGQGNPQPQTVTIANCGPAGDWSVAPANGSGWLGASPANGHLGAGATQDVSVSVSSSGLNPDTYHDALIFSMGSAKVQVAVKFTIASAAPPPPPPPPAMPCLQVNTGALSFSATQGGGDPKPQVVTITNCGNPGRWAVSISTDDGAHWLYANARGGALDGGASLDVAIGVSNSLPPGTYTGHITFTIETNGGTKSVTVAVTFTVS